MASAESIELPTAVLRPVRGHHAFESCVEQLAGSIRLGVFPLGSSLPPERELAERMGVSRATLREAIAALRSVGMVRTTRGRGGGTVVDHRPEPPSATNLSHVEGRRAELLDALAFRRIVEPGASYRAATLPLRQIHKDMLCAALDEVSAAPGPATHRQADSRLHLAIAAVGESPMTIAAVAEVQTALHEMLSAIPVLEVNIEHSRQQHEAVVEAILRRNAPQARRVMESHCDDTAALLRGLLEMNPHLEGTR